MNATYFGYEVQPDSRKDRGYSVPGSEVAWGRMTVAQIMEGADMRGLVSHKKSAHNEVTLTYENGVKVCRFRGTDIVQIDGFSNLILLDTGGWNTISTRRHMMDFLAREGVTVGLWGAKKGDKRNVLCFFTYGGTRGEFYFTQLILFNPVGGILTDHDDPYMKDLSRGTYQ